MNETLIIQNFLYELKDIQKKVKKNVPLSRNIEVIRDCLIGSKGTTVYFMAENYELLESLLNINKFSNIEKGCVFSKILACNFPIIASEPYCYIRLDKYIDEFSKFGVSYQEFPSFFYKYIERKEEFYFEQPNLEYIENALNNLTIGNMDHLYFYALQSLKSFFKTQQFCDICASFREELSKIKTKKEILNFLEVNPFASELRTVIMQKVPISESTINEIFISYFQNGDLKQYKEKQNIAFKELMKNILEIEENYRLELVQFYQPISDFMNKKEKEILDYQNIIRAMLEKLPVSLVEDFISYMLEKEKGIDRGNKKKTKKKLKKELLKYYNEKEPVEFDYKDFSKLLEVLRELQYPDSVNHLIFSGVLQHAILNDNYYDFLISKNKFDGTDQDKIQEIEDVRELMSYADNAKERADYYSYLCQLRRYLEVNAHTFDYEMSLLYSKKN